MNNNQKAEVLMETPLRIRVEVKNDILGNCVFWEGLAADINQIRNIPARETAKQVAKDRLNRVNGMWHVFAG